MNGFNIVQEGIIGSKEALTKLAKSTSAKLLLVSDTHGYKQDLQSVICRYGNEVDALLFSGDGIDDVLYSISIALYDPELKKALPPVIAVVAGNCDSLSYLLNLEPKNTTHGWRKNPESKVVFPEMLVVKVCGQNIFLTHGHVFSVNITDTKILEEARDKNCNIIIHGHTHCQTDKTVDTQKIINPGSLVNPRNSSFAGFGMLELKGTGGIKIEFIPYFRK